MYIGNSSRFVAGRASGILALTLLATTLAVASEQGESRGSLLALTSSNEPATNQVPVFELMTVGTLAVSLVQMLSTGGKGAISE